MSSSDSDTGGTGRSARTLLMFVVIFVTYQIGRGLARGFMEGDYARGVLGVTVLLGLAFSLLFLVKKEWI